MMRRQTRLFDGQPYHLADPDPMPASLAADRAAQLRADGYRVRQVRTASGDTALYVRPSEAPAAMVQGIADEIVAAHIETSGAVTLSAAASELARRVGLAGEGYTVDADDAIRAALERTK